MWLSRTLVCLGLFCGIPSVWETLAFSWNPDFQAPRLHLGPTHTNYHAFREFTLTMGVVILMLYVMFLPSKRRTQPLWTVMLITAVGYYGGWWLPGPFLGLYAPTQASGIVHLAATVLSLAGIIIAWKHFPQNPDLMTHKLTPRTTP